MFRLLIAVLEKAFQRKVPNTYYPEKGTDTARMVLVPLNESNQTQIRLNRMFNVKTAGGSYCIFLKN
ncbi:MAG: hypothetical protein H7Y13_06080 [Sphingobacteriaceae bacterium]|nr:hypothetical protein [Sphingobacteriaceae bacterium]